MLLTNPKIDGTRTNVPAILNALPRTNPTRYTVSGTIPIPPWSSLNPVDSTEWHYQGIAPYNGTASPTVANGCISASSTAGYFSGFSQAPGANPGVRGHREHPWEHRPEVREPQRRRDRGAPASAPRPGRREAQRDQRQGREMHAHAHELPRGHGPRAAPAATGVEQRQRTQRRADQREGVGHRDVAAPQHRPRVQREQQRRRPRAAGAERVVAERAHPHARGRDQQRRHRAQR